MKKRVFAAIAALAISVATFAWEFPGFEWTVGADFTSAYLWRGLNFGGLAVQPDVMIGYGGLQLEGWANISAENNNFKNLDLNGLAPELDITLSYSVVGLRVGVTHQYYFDETPFMNYKIPTIENFELGEYASNQTEVFAEFNLGDLVEEAPLHIGWYTFVGGDDYLVDEEAGTVKRAYSSYIDVSYEFGLPLGFSLTPTVGMTPWASMYNYYENKFSVNNVSLKLNWELEVGDHFALDVYGIGMVNTAGINKENVWSSISDSYSDVYGGLGVSRRLNFALGVGIWLF